jgi:hypothetical protein
MGASTRVYVKVVKEVCSWVEVSAVTLDEAKVIARNEDKDVVRVAEAQYDPPYSETET